MKRLILRKKYVIRLLALAALAFLFPALLAPADDLVITIPSSANVIGPMAGTASSYYYSGVTAFSSSTTSIYNYGTTSSIYGYTPSGNIVINNYGKVTGSGYGILAIATGSGNLTINNFGIATGLTSNTYYSSGITANNNGTGNVSIFNSGIALGGYGIYAQSLSSGNVFVYNAGIATGQSHSGIYLYSASGNVSMVNSGTISGYDYGLRTKNTISGTNFVTLNGGTISGPAAAVYLYRPVDAQQLTNEVLTINGAATLTNGAGGPGLMQGNGGTLRLNLIGVNASELAGLNSAATTTTQFFTVGTHTYMWNNLALSPNIITLQNLVDPSIGGLAAALDANGQSLSSAFDPILVNALNNPQATLFQLSGKEILDASSQIPLNATQTLLDSTLADRFDAIGHNPRGLDFSRFDISNNALDLAFTQTAQHLHALSMADLLGSVTKRDTVENVVTEPGNRWGIWGAGTFVLASQDAYGGSSAYHSFTGSPTVGADYRVTPDFTLGSLATYANTTSTFSDASHLGVASESGALYALYRRNDWSFKGIVGGGLSQFDSHRQVFGSIASAHPGGSQVFSDVTAGYDFIPSPAWTITPEIGLQQAHESEDAYSEGGAGPLDLDIDKQASDSLRSHVGFRIKYMTHVGDIYLTQRISAAAYHEFLENAQNVSEDISGAPSLGSFNTKTNSPERDFAVIGYGVDVKFKLWLMDMAAFATYTIQTGQEHFIAHSIDGGMRTEF